MASAARRQIIGGAPTNYRRRRADQQKSAAAPTKCRRRRRGATGARLCQGVLFWVIMSGILFRRYCPGVCSGGCC